MCAAAQKRKTGNSYSLLVHTLLLAVFAFSLTLLPLNRAQPTTREEKSNSPRLKKVDECGLRLFFASAEQFHRFHRNCVRDKCVEMGRRNWIDIFLISVVSLCSAAAAANSLNRSLPDIDIPAPPTRDPRQRRVSRHSADSRDRAVFWSSLARFYMSESPAGSRICCGEIF